MAPALHTLRFTTRHIIRTGYWSFVLCRLAQGILYRGAGPELVWGDFLAIAGIGAVFFTLALLRFRRSVTQTRI